jgi:hypothetical protein
MRLLDTYALQCGAKIDKPFIYESYFPISVNKYITLQGQSKYEGKDYDYWQDVIDILAPALQKNGIQIVQVGHGKERPYKRVVNLCGQTTFNQLAYVLKNSLLHVGPDSVSIHFASHYDIPIVGLYSVSSKEVSGPHFGNPEKQFIFKGYERVGNGKPSFAAQENPKSINTIKPEEIANQIFKLLGIDFVTPFKTVYTGSRYSSNMMRELLPDSTTTINNPEATVELRMDLSFNLQILVQQLQYLKKAVIVTDRPIDLKIIKHFKANISLLVYRLTQEDSPEFIKEVISTGVSTIILSEMSDEEIEKKKIKYFEFGKIHKVLPPNAEKVAELQKDTSNLFYRSAKIIGSKKAVYPSHAAREKGVALANDFEYSKVIDSPSFWQDLEFYTIVRLEK